MGQYNLTDIELTEEILDFIHQLGGDWTDEQFIKCYKQAINKTEGKGI